jgi:hypothetical protein
MIVSSGGYSNPGVTLSNCLGLGVACTYNTSSLSLSFEGGSPAALDAKGVLLTRTAGLVRQRIC